jgi:short subunit dehydrogenase-like uncharacterized protein
VVTGAARPLLLYGAAGYTGELVARRAAERGLPLVLAGRRAGPLAALAAGLGADHRAFALEDRAALDDAIARSAAVLHCAGPFARTWRPVAEACLRAGRPYVDITGEPPVLAALAALDGEARRAGVLLLPGAGFDVVPSDTLALHVKRRLPSADRIVLAMRGFGRISGGTARTLLESLARGGAGAGPLPPPRRFTLGGREVTAIAVPSADVVAARHSTGVRDVAFYMAVPRPLRLASRAAALAAPLAPLLRLPLARRLAVRALTGGRAGPSAEERARGRVHLYAEATDRAGGRAAARLRTPDGYAFTALAMVAVAERVLGGDAPPGFHTPASAYGPDLAIGLPDVLREDEA